MIHPSYTELIDAVNERYDGEEPLVRSRYSIVHAAAHRARQLVSGAEPFVESKYELDKPLTVAVDELYEGYVRILPEGAAQDGEEEFFFEDEMPEDAAAEELTAEDAVEAVEAEPAVAEASEAAAADDTEAAADSEAPEADEEADLS